MSATIKRLGSACAGALLMACSGALLAPSAQTPPAGYARQLADGYAALARAQYDATRYADALRSYRRAAELDPRNVGARNGMAVAQAALGDYKPAIALWRGMMADGAAAAQSAFLLANLGYAYLLDGDAGQAATLLEQACVLDPLDALAWEHLGLALEKTGQHERAAAMLKQARALRLHDARGDYALVSASGAARTEVAQDGAMVAVRRVNPVDVRPPEAAVQASMAQVEIGVASIYAAQPLADRGVAAPSPASTPMPTRTSTSTPTSTPARALRLEINNGNGVTGMAAALARTIGGREWQVVRLSNTKPFAVAASRIEYQAPQLAAARALAARLGMQLLERDRENERHVELRVVLGRDLRDPLALARRYRQPLNIDVALDASAGIGKAGAPAAAQ